MATQLKQPAPPLGSVAWFDRQIEEGAIERSEFYVTITPEVAISLLARNTANRQWKIHALEQYRRAMRFGFWRGLNGESIKFKKDGTLGDGQHRLRALIEEKISIETKVMFGLDQEDIDTIDQGKARTAADVDRMNGGDLSEISAAACRKLIAYETQGGSSVGSTSRISNAEVNDRLHKDGGIRDASRWAMAHKCPGLPGSTVAFLWYILHGVHAAACEEYLTQVCKGINLNLRDPAATVRDYLINRSNSGNKFSAKKIEAVLRGFNAFREGRTFGKIVTTGTLPELV